MTSFSMLAQAVVSGVVTGSVYALVALSLVIVYKATDVVNFAGGELVMAGSYLGLLLLLWADLPYVVMFALVPLCTFLLGGLFNRNYRRMAYAAMYPMRATWNGNRTVRS